jgi:hypothetical protein
MKGLSKSSVIGRASTNYKFAVEIPPVKDSLLIASGALLGLAAGTVAGGPLGLLAGAKYAKDQWVIK